MDAKAAAADLHNRLRHLGENVRSDQPLTICLFLDGENAWEYYPGNGRAFLREFYGRIQGDQDFRALTATESIAAAGELPTTAGIFPASWINANFDVWIGHAEDVAAWNYCGTRGKPTRTQSKRASREGPTPRRKPPSRTLANRCSSRKAATGAGGLAGAQYGERCRIRCPISQAPHGRLSDAGQLAPEELAKPIKRRPEHAVQLAPTGKLNITIDGRDTSYFEWLGAGLYSPERRGGSMHGRVFYLHELRYGFEEDRLCVRIDPFAEALGELENPEFRITIGGVEEITIVVNLERGHVHGFAVEKTVCACSIQACRGNRL